MSDSWRGSYDAWKLATPPEYECDEPEPEDDTSEVTAFDLDLEIANLEATIVRLRAEMGAATAWAAAYEREHGQFKRCSVPMPDHMIVF